MCVCYWPPVRGVCPYYEVVEFQYQTATPPEPRICCLLLHIYSLPTPPSLTAVQCPSGGNSTLLPRHPLHRRPSCISTESSAHLSITVPLYQCSWPRPYSYISVLSQSDPPLISPLLPDSHFCPTLAFIKISSNVTFS